MFSLVLFFIFFIKIKPVDQQLCIAHAIQLAVLEDLYLPQPEPNVPIDELLNYLEDDEEEEMYCDEAELKIVEKDSVSFNFTFGPKIQKVRTIVRSPIKNDKQNLQNKVEQFI